MKQNNMKIKTLKQIKKNIYKIEVENGEDFLLFDETIINFNLTVGNNINNLNEIMKYNDSMFYYYKILNKLKYSMRSEKEVIDLLKNETDNIDVIIGKLKKINVINDELYIKNYISKEINTTLNGPSYIKKSLINKGCNIDCISLELDKIEETIWSDRINLLIKKKDNSNKKYSKIEMESRLKSYLISKGYVVNNIDIKVTSKDADIIEKEYNKLLIKYNRKNKDISLIKYDLYKKGFDKFLVDEYINKNKFENTL